MPGSFRGAYLPGDPDVLNPTLAWASTLCACAVMAAGCSGTPTSSDADAQPVRVGTLRIIGSSDVDHLDSASAY